jgi:hypothetical protein
MIYLQVSKQEKEDIYPSNFRGSHLTQRESLDLEGVKIFKRKVETIPSSPSIVHRETTIDPVDPIDPVNPVAPVDIPRDIAVGHKRPVWA